MFVDSSECQLRGPHRRIFAFSRTYPWPSLDYHMSVHIYIYIHSAYIYIYICMHIDIIHVYIYMQI